jgi:uncharacterized membrane protein YdjX (TVP38/TMEM64 family)
MIEERVQSTYTSPLRAPGRYVRPLIIAGVWVLLLALIQFVAWRNGMTAGEMQHQLVVFGQSSMYAPLIFFAAAAISPLVLFPAALLGLAAGMVFGPVWGLMYTLIGCNVSATVAYSIGRFSRSGSGSPRESGILSRYGDWMRRNSFTAILMMRLTFLPYDPVSYLTGALHINWFRFMIANTFGCLPGALALTLVGASVG